MRVLFSQIELDEFIASQQGAPSPSYRLAGTTLNFWLILDWKALWAETGIDRYNGPYVPEHKPCFCCPMTKEELRHGWLAEPFSWHCDQLYSEADLPNRVLRALPLANRRYDPMHMCQNGAMHVMRCFGVFIPKYHPSRAKLSSIYKNMGFSYAEDLTKVKFTPKLMKKMFRTFARDEIREALLSIDVGDVEVLHVRMEDGSCTLFTLGKALCTTYDSVYVFFLFSYLEKPTRDDFLNLLDAREMLLTIFAHLKAEQRITFHYMVTHFILYAIKDGSAYWYLNEASEKSNDILKKELRAIGTGPGKLVGSSGRDILATVLRRRRLRNELRRLGWAKEENLPRKAGNPSSRCPTAYHQRIVIKPAELITAEW